MVAPSAAQIELQITRLDPAQHNRAQFDCGVDALNRYLKQQATQDMRRQIAICYVAVDKPTEHGARIVGFYTLASAAIPITDLPEEIAVRLPRYPTVPAARLGRLAIDRTMHGKKLGAALLADALSKCLDSPLAIYALVVDAKDEGAALFYRHFGFIPFQSLPLTLFLPLATAHNARQR